MVPGPGYGAPPTGQFGPQFIQSAVRCGTLYLEMTPAAFPTPPLCDCGTYAIGVCRDCEQPVCGFHSTLYDGVRLHHQHVSEREERKRIREEQRAEEARRRAEEEQRQRDEQVQQRARTRDRKCINRACEAVGLPTSREVCDLCRSGTAPLEQ